MCYKSNKYFSINIAKVPLSAGCCLMTTFDGAKVNKKKATKLSPSLIFSDHNYFVASSETFLKFLSSFSKASETFLAL